MVKVVSIIVSLLQWAQAVQNVQLVILSMERNKTVVVKSVLLSLMPAPLVTGMDLQLLVLIVLMEISSQLKMVQPNSV